MTHLKMMPSNISMAARVPSGQKVERMIKKIDELQ